MATKHVRGVGPLPARIVLVGEAPGEQENIQGLPFVGGAGRVLDMMLKRAGLDRATLFVTNVFRTRPPFNNVSHFFAKKSEAKRAGYDSPHPPYGTAGILRPDFQPHIDELVSEIQAATPNLVVAMGATALWALCGLDKIGKYRGAVLESTLVKGVKVLPTYHPAGVMRQWRWVPTVVADLMKARAEGEFPEIRRPFRLIHTSPAAYDIDCFIERALECEAVAVDIETVGRTITTVGIAISPYEAMSINMMRATEKSRNHAWGAVRRLMMSPVTKVFQNGSYDIRYFHEYKIPVRGLIEDTMVMHHALQPELEKSLGYMGSLYTNEGAWKNMVSFKEEKKDA